MAPLLRAVALEAVRPQNGLSQRQQGACGRIGLGVGVGKGVCVCKCVYVCVRVCVCVCVGVGVGVTPYQQTLDIPLTTNQTCS